MTTSTLLSLISTTFLVLIYMRYIDGKGIFKRWRNRREEKKQSVTKQKNDEDDGLDASKTLSLLQHALTTLGGRAVTEEFEDETRIYYDYQGGHFFFVVSPDSVFVKLFYPQWYCVELDDIDKFSFMCRQINNANRNSQCTCFYVIDDEHNEANFYATCNFVLVEQLPQLADYVDSRLQTIFSTIRSISEVVNEKTESPY